MMLADSFKILSAAQSDIYARALRAIGQDLAPLFPEKLEIEIQGENFIVRGQCPRGRYDASQETPKEKSFTDRCLEVLSRDLLDRAPRKLSTSVEFSRVYAPEDVTRIDEIGIRRRSTVGKLPDIRSLGEVLRTIGRLVDGHEGRLIRLSRDAGRVVYEFTEANGTPHNETISNLELYNLQKRFYEKRGASEPVDPWKNSL